MKKSKRTKDCGKLSTIFFILSCLCFVGIAIFTIVLAFSRTSQLGGNDFETFTKAGVEITIKTEALKAQLISLGTTALIFIFLSMFIKEKARITIYMISLLVCLLCKGSVAGYIVCGVWLADEYIFKTLHNHYKLLKITNKEIDRRE